MKKKVLFFGIFDPEYSRNRVLIEGFSRLGHEVHQCRVDPQRVSGLKKYVDLFWEYRKLKHKFNIVIVAFPGHTIVPLARILFGRRIIFDAFVSLYNSVVEDRQRVSRFSIRAYWYFMLDWVSLRIGGTILIDTRAHRDFISDKFKIPKSKFVVVPVGSDDSVVYPVSSKKEKFIVHFHGSGIPLQGIEYIEKAARLLEFRADIEFHLYGPSGKDTTNLKYKGRFLYKDMSQIMAKASIVLGIFGSTQKAGLVVPNKVYEGWASKKPVITARTSAVMEAIESEKNVLFVEPACPKDIADKICLLKENSKLAEEVAYSGYNLFKEKYTPEKVVKKIISNV